MFYVLKGWMKFGLLDVDRRRMRPEPLRGDGVFAPAAFERDDDAPDDRFYALARKVVHIDDGAIAALGRGTSDVQHLTLVRAYFEAAGSWTDAREEDRSPGAGGDPLYAVWARAS